MNLRALVVDDLAKQKVKRVRQFAERKNNWYHGAGKVPGDDPRYVCHLDTYRCVFTYTVHPSGLIFRHLSISVPGAKYPNVFAACTIAELFGFTGWDGKSYEKLPPDWMGHVSDEEHCVVLVQRVPTPVVIHVKESALLQDEAKSREGVPTHPIPENADVMTLQDFVRAVLCYSFVDDDGSGYYGTETEMTRLPAVPSTILKYDIDLRWSHVIWFNK